MKLITEYTEDIKCLTEDVDPITGKPADKKTYMIEGIFMQAETKNRNGRVYPSSVLEREVQNYNENFVQRNRALGELGHPDHYHVNLDRACMKIENLWKEGNNFYGKAKILDNDMGRIVKNFIDEGVVFGVSSRAIGSLKSKNGIQEVQDDLRLSAVDIVHDPSAAEAFVNGVMEGKEWVCENGVIKEVTLDNYQKQIKEATKSQIDEGLFLNLFEDFLNNLKNKNS